MPELFGATKIKIEYVVVSLEVLRQLPEIYGGRYGGRYGEPVGCEVVKISENS